MQTAAALLIKNLGKSILGEGSEELFTELANAAADTLIMGDLSDYNLAVRQYKAQGESEEEARRHAGWDVAKQAGLAFAGGGLMGFGSAAGGMAYNGAANRYAAPRAVESGSFYNALQYGLAQGEDTTAGRLARELAGRDTASSADVMRMLRAAESRQAEGGPGAQTLVDPQLYTRAEVQGMSAGEVRENYDAIQESMRLWDKNGELQGGTQSRMVDRQAPGEDNETTSGNERLYTRAEVQRMSEEEQLANVDAIRESMGLWDAEGKLAEQGSNSPDDGWDVQGKEAFKSNEEAYEYYLKVANELDVSTSFNTAVFYSGPGNRALAEAFARENNKTTLEITEGGKYLDALHLFSNESALTTEQAANVWKKLSERYAQGASGNAYGFVKGSRDGSIFNTVEYPALKSNPDITNIFTELFQKGENE